MSSPDRYVPPHKRNIVRASRNPHYDNSTDNSRVYNPKRRNFSEGSKFNTIVDPPKPTKSNGPKEPGLIQIPEIIIPPIVESIILDDESLTSQEFLVKDGKSQSHYCTDQSEIKLSQDVDFANDIVEVHDDNIQSDDSPQIQFYRKMARLRVEHAQKQADGEFIEWNNHYKRELHAMYEECVNPDLKMSHNQFVQIAYNCTRTEFDKKKFKQIRPLL